MSFIKKYAWYGSAVVASTLLAVALLLASSVGTANAAGAITTITMTNGTNSWLAGSSNPAASQVAGFTTVTLIPAGTTTIELTFPTGTTFGSTASTFGNWTFNNDGDASTLTATAVSISGTTVTITATVAVGGTAGYAAATAVVVTAAQAGQVIFPVATTSTGSFTVSTKDSTGTVLDTGTVSTIALIATDVTPAPTSIPGDGISTTVLTIASNAATAANDIISISTNAGGFTNVTASGGGAGVLGSGCSAPTSAVPATTVQCTTAAGTTTTAAGTVTLRAPNTGAGTISLSVYIQPAAGGAARLLKQLSVTLTAPAAAPVLTTISISPTTTISVGASGVAANAAAITITLKDQNNANLASGTTVTVSTDFGVIDSNGTTCQLGDGGDGPDTGSDVDCTFSSTGGSDVVNAFGTNLSGTATVTIKATPFGSTTPISVTKTVNFTGSVSTVTALTQSSVNAVFTAAATPNSTTFTNGFRVSSTAKDSAGVTIIGFSPTTVAVSPSTCANVGATTASTATATALTTLTVGTASAGTVCTVTVTSGSGSTAKTATATFTIGGTFSSTTSTMEVGAVDAAVATSQTVTVTVKDSNGNLVGDGTSVSIVASAGAFVATTAYTVNGVASFTYVTPGTAQSVSLTAVSGTLTSSKTISVGAAATPTATATPAGEGTFDRTIPNVGVNTAVWNGGTVDQLSTATAAAGGISVTVFVDGKATVLIPGAPAFVNAAFNAAFADGSVPSGTIVLVVK